MRPTRREESAERLSRLVGADRVDRIRLDHEGDAAEPVPRVRPADATAVAEVVRACARDDLALDVVGGGGCPAAMLPLERLDAILSLDAIDRVVEHEPGDLTVHVQGGCSLASLQAAMAAAGQFLPVEVASPDRATIGGILASRACGPSRTLYGTPRDRLLGVGFVDGAGRFARAGGRVVKNVAGYDLMKLLVGSYGTLGVIVEATLRVQPVPEGRDVWIVTRPTPESFAAFVRTLRRSPVVPAFVTVADPGRTATLDARLTGWSLAIGLDGLESERVSQIDRLDDASASLGGNDVARCVLSGLEAIAWSRNLVRRAGEAIDADVLVEVHAPAVAVLRVLAETGLVSEREADVVVHLQADVATGIASVAWREADTDSVALLWRLLGPAQEAGGFLRVLRGSPRMRREAGRWGPHPAALSVARRLKAAFDPSGILAPGRMPGVS